MTRLAWFNCFSGIAGDMALASLIDAGAPLAEVDRACRTLGVQGWELRAERVERGGLQATFIRVAVAEKGHPHRPAREVIELVGNAPLPERARNRAVATFRKLAEVEGALHGQAPQDVEFHEVGAVDSIVDVVGVCVALELLAIDQVFASPVAQGVGSIRSAHGVLPNPPPAVVRLLSGIPIIGVDVAMELTTPTGAALLAANASGFGPVPAMTVEASGFGAGGRDVPGRANVVQVVIGSSAGAQSSPVAPSEMAIVVETTVDDVTGEQLGYTINRLLAAGALDAWVGAVTMKKGRPGHVVTVLCSEATAEPLTRLLLAETGSLGARRHTVGRIVLARHGGEVVLEGHRIRIKAGPNRAKAEYDDAAAAAEALGRTLHEVVAAAEAIWRSGQPEPPGGKLRSGDVT